MDTDSESLPTTEELPILETHLKIR